MRSVTSVKDVSASAEVLRAGIDGMCVPGVLAVVTQPIVRLSDFTTVGYEAFVRVPANPPNAPDWWLERADEIDMRARLEIACWRAIAEIGAPPNDGMLFVNVSPGTLAEPDLLALREVMPKRMVIEVTEQEAVADYVAVRKDLDPWLSNGARLAIDDAGAGHSSLRHVIELEPDFIKIDRSLIQGIDNDRNRRALVHSLVAFAREVGITVIAEGIETDGELDIVRDAGASLGQGYLFARPGRGWPSITEDFAPDHNQLWSWDRQTPPAQREEARLREKLRQAPDTQTACEAVVDFLHRQGQLMPSLYLERDGQLRCIAQRGLWQVLDGMSGTSGVTGRTWASSEVVIVPDVRQSDEYLEAIPGVMSEICVPVFANGETIGALNVESLAPLPPDIVGLLQHCVELLSERLKSVGWRGKDVSWRRAARASMTISQLALEGKPPEALIEILRESSGMDSVCLVRMANGAPEIAASAGPLGSILAALPDAEIASLAGLVDHVNSCYTANDATGRGFVGTESIRALARAVAVLPIRSAGASIGIIVLASSHPRALSGDDIEPLELLAGQLAASLEAAALLERLRHQHPPEG